MRATQLLAKAKVGLISPKEIAEVARELVGNSRESDPYTLIHILGVSGATEYEPLVARFLNASFDPMLARIALQVLCSHWGMASRYRDQVEKFVRGVEWDIDADVRIVALSAAGELLRERLGKSLLRLLVEIFTSSAERHIVRQAAYFALARAHGQDWAQLPPASRQIDLERDIDPRVLEWALSHAA
jgi:hypothetical protein